MSAETELEFFNLTVLFSHCLSEFDVFGFDTTTLFDQNIQLHFHVVHMGFLTITGVLGGCAVLHFPSQKFFFWRQMIETLTFTGGFGRSS